MRRTITLLFIAALLVVPSYASAARCKGCVQEGDNTNEVEQNGSERSGSEHSDSDSDSDSSSGGVFIQRHQHDDNDDDDDDDVDDDVFIDHGDNDFFDNRGRRATDTARRDDDDDDEAAVRLPVLGGLRTPRAPRTPRLPGERPDPTADVLPISRVRDDNTLPRTGADLAMFAMFGLALIGAGLALMAVRTRDREVAVAVATPPWGDEPLIGW